MKISTIPALVAGVLWLAGCADGNFRPYVLDDSFGKTAKQMVNASIANPQAAKNPPADSPRKMDGYAGVNTINSYRQTFSQIEQPQGLTINIGGSSGSSGSGGQ
ncbi:MAG: hypothetical protein WAW61_10640 [Methylococcaceae bacterium]